MAETTRSPARPTAICFAGGGTGGHLYPAIAIAEALRRRKSEIRIVFLGTNRAIDQKILAAVDCEFLAQELPRSSLWPWKWPHIGRTIARCWKDVRSKMREIEPVAVIGTGGLGSVAPVWVAQRQSVPVFLLNPDAIPGRANRFLARTAKCIFAQWEDSRGYLPRVNVQVLGCPVRRAFREWDQVRGREYFGLDARRKTLLITGASQGARTVNEAVIELAERLSERKDWQILHLTGETDHSKVKAAYERVHACAIVLPFTHDMPAALAASDLVISRAGASTLAEITAVGRAAVLIPYPFHRDKHQTANARCLERESAAILIDDAISSRANAPILARALARLMDDDVARGHMANASARLGRAEAAERIADEILAQSRS